jgi:hypothetical protein
MTTQLFPNYNIISLYAIYLKNPYYTGPIIQIRRGNDNALLDFYGDVSGNLTSTTVSGILTTYSSWINGTIGYVVTWYDQSGNNNHVIGSNQSLQPQLAFVNSKYVVYFNGNGVGLTFINPVQTCYSIATQIYTFSQTYHSILCSGYNDAVGFRLYNNQVYNLTGNYSSEFLAPINSYWYLNGTKGIIGGTLQLDGSGNGISGNNGIYNDLNWNYIIAIRDRDITKVTSNYYIEPFTSIGMPTNSGLYSQSLNGYMSELILFNNKINDIDANILNQQKLI